NISIDGEVHGWFRDDTPLRFEAYGWQVVRNVDGHNPAEIKKAIETARASKDKPTLICCKTVIGFGSPNFAGKEKAHGSALGEAEIKLVREKLDWPHAPFEIPDEIRAGWDAREKGKAAQEQWNTRFSEYSAKYPQEAAEFTRRMRGELPADWAATAQALIADAAKADKPVATRKSSKFALDAIAAKLPELFGGSADLTESNCTDFKGYKLIKPGDFSGNYISYGVREFGMSAAINGIVLHGGLLPFGGTFLTFSDYARNAIRMAALMKIGSVFVYTHDSIGLGEDGPTHQSVEHVSSLRLIPGLQVWRPADQFESAVAWACAIERRNGPSALALSRQNLNPQPHLQTHFENARRGGYVLLEPATAPKAVIIATGSEVQLAVDAAKKLIDPSTGSGGTAVRVVSMPCVEVFLKQDAAYRESVLPHSRSGIKRLAIEAGVSLFWRGIVGESGDVLGVDTYGESAPASAVFKHFGFTVDNVVARVAALIA
ncbi:MAG: transketolase family protein, partial [Stenotrophobium sp.]